MQEARVQVETKESISGEIRACWFDLPIDTALFEEVTVTISQTRSFPLLMKYGKIQPYWNLTSCTKCISDYQTAYGKNTRLFLSTMKIWKNFIITEMGYSPIQTARA